VIRGKNERIHWKEKLFDGGVMLYLWRQSLWFLALIFDAPLPSTGRPEYLQAMPSVDCEMQVTYLGCSPRKKFYCVQCAESKTRVLHQSQTKVKKSDQCYIQSYVDWNRIPFQAEGNSWPWSNQLMSFWSICCSEQVITEKLGLKAISPKQMSQNIIQ